MKSIADPRYLEIIASLRAAREKAGMSQEELASRIGKPQSFVSKVEVCERRLDMIETLVVCEALGITLDLIVPSHLRHLIGKGG
jgi:ribosome-binding protein aMBF1 (putative translation factor)